MMNKVMKRLLIGTTMVACLGGSPALAQGMPSMASPAMSPYASATRRMMPGGTIASPSPTGAAGFTLGSLQVYTGTLGQSQGPALGNITICPVSGTTGAGSTWPAISSLAPSATAVSPSPASPPLTSPLATFPVTTSPVPVLSPATTSPLMGSPSVTTAVPSASTSSIVTPLGGTLPATTGFGTSNVIGFCNPSSLGATTTTQTLPDSLSPTGAAFSDAAIPLSGTESGGGGFSPMVDVPPPALFTPADAVIPTQ